MDAVATRDLISEADDLFRSKAEKEEASRDLRNANEVVVDVEAAPIKQLVVEVETTTLE